MLRYDLMHLFAIQCRWEEDRKEDGTKWRSLEHKGPVFAAPYEPIPDDVRFFYEGDVMQLTQDTEEVATFYARMLDHDYTSKEIFNRNFFKDWRKVYKFADIVLIMSLSSADMYHSTARPDSNSSSLKISRYRIKIVILAVEPLTIL